jgi:hypothetical protein
LKEKFGVESAIVRGIEVCAICAPGQRRGIVYAKARKWGLL